MRKYDTTFIIDGQLNQSDREAAIEKAENFVKKLGGTMERVVRWGNRKLAYEINKKTHGYYVIFYYSGDPSMVKPFENELRLMESVLRYMTVVFKGEHPDYIREEDSQTPQASVEKDSFGSEDASDVDVSEFEDDEDDSEFDENDEYIDADEDNIEDSNDKEDEVSK